MWYYGAGETGPFTNEGISGVSKDCDLIKKCVTGVELDDGVGDALLFGDCGDENTMKANVSSHEDLMLNYQKMMLRPLLFAPPYELPETTMYSVSGVGDVRQRFPGPPQAHKVGGGRGKRKAVLLLRPRLDVHGTPRLDHRNRQVVL